MERTREYSIAPFPHHGLVCGAPVYLGLERYLYWNLQRTLGAECRTIGTQLLTQHPFKRADWLETEIDEAYAPGVNGHFIRVMQVGVGVLYLSGAPKDGAFDPSHVPLPNGEEKNRPRKLRLGGGRQLLIESLQFTAPDVSKFVIESGFSYHQI